MNRYRVRHLTSYQYSDSVSSSRHSAHLSPRSHARQAVISSFLTALPQPEQWRRYEDFAGNLVHDFSIISSYQECGVMVESIVEVESAPALAPSQQIVSWEDWRQHCCTIAWPQRRSVADSLYASRATAWSQEISTWSATSFTPGRPVNDCVLEINQRIFDEFRYRPGLTDVDTPLDEIMQHRHGVCQDFAHLMIAALRSHGIPTRYVSGYLETLPPPGQERLVGADASHAWVSVFLPEIGWVDFDPTNKLLVGDRHITLAWGRDYHDVTPLKGVVVGGGEQNIIVSVDVEAVPSLE